MSEERYILSFEKAPKLLFVSPEGHPWGSRLYIDGKEIRGITRLEITSDINDTVRHCVVCVTKASGEITRVKARK